MSEVPENNVIAVVEVSIQKIVSPTITVFSTLVKGPRGSWEETFGSEELVNSYLLGVTCILATCVTAVPLLRWTIPKSFGEPSGMRWTILKDGLPIVEELDSKGNVIPPV